MADPRHGGEPKFNNRYRVVRWVDVSPTVTGATGPSAGGLAVGDPRTGYGENTHSNVLRVTPWEGQCRLGDRCPPPFGRRHGRGRSALGGAPVRCHVPWAELRHGRWSVADPRLPAARTGWSPASQPGRDVSRAILDLGAGRAAEPGRAGGAPRTGRIVRFRLARADWECGAARGRRGDRQHDGHDLLLAWRGESFMLSNTPIWVRNVAVALSVAGRLVR